MRARRHHGGRRGAATVEFAILLPLLAFVFVIGADFARVFYSYTTITNCARNGAVWASWDSARAADSEGIKTIALADAKDLSPAPVVTSEVANNAGGQPVVRVTVNWTFETITRFPGVPSSVNLTRTVEMRVAPTAPKEL